MTNADTLLTIACDLTANLAAEDRYRRLITAVRNIIRCDAATMMRQHGEDLIPVAFAGLVPEVAGRRFARREHPRLDLILRHRGPLRFPADSKLPDPFDGLLLSDPSARASVHACMGSPLTVGGNVIGVLTVDASDPHAFDALDDQTVATLAALAGAAMHTAILIEALEQSSTRREQVVRQLQRDEQQRTGGQLLGVSAALDRVRREVSLVANSDMAVLITGESGVGKEVVAHTIHAASHRHDEPMIHVNCAALPESIAESELFGHVRGSFTGATADRAGKFELADGGTLFLDEVGELPLSLQPKLLRALQQGEIQRVGSDRPITVSVRIIAATNRDLFAEQRAGRFRADLYHRLGAYPLHIPPLRERQEDIAVLAGHLLDQACMRFGQEQARLTVAARRALEHYSWPGNVRELDHVLMRAVLRAAGGRPRGLVLIDQQHLDIVDSMSAPLTTVVPLSSASLTTAVDEFTRTYIQNMVAAHDGNWSAAGRAMGIDRGNLHRMGRRLGLLAPGTKDKL